jgi:hypothetical protein
MQRRTFIMLMGAEGAFRRTARAETAEQQVFDLFTKIAGALSDGDPGIFIDALDPSMPGRDDFRRSLIALADLADVTNSIEIYSDTGDDTRRTEQLDWFMEIVDKSASHTVERRRQTVTFQMERKGKKWKIVSIEPKSLFAPPKTT